MTTGRLKRVVKKQIIPLYGKKGSGWTKNPRKAAYNAVYHKVTIKSPLLNINKSNKIINKKVSVPKPVLSSTINLNNNGAETIATSSEALNSSSSNFEQLKRNLTNVYENHLQLKKQFIKAKNNYRLTFLFSSKEKRESKKQNVSKLEDDLNHAYIDVNFRKYMNDKNSWDEVSYYFQELMKCDKIWDLTFRQDTDKLRERTIADETINRKAISYHGPRMLDFIKADVDNLYLPNLNGADLYIYPTFIVLFKDYKQFSIHDLQQLDISMKDCNFNEEEGAPSDVRVVGQTYKYTNKNGTPDKRYSDNYNIPIVKYGDLKIMSKTGIKERYMFSNITKFADFGKSFVNYVKLNLNNKIIK